MKKLLKITGTLAFGTALFFTVSLNGENQSGNLDLASLTKMSEANAECVTGGFASGRCLQLSQICVFSTPPDNSCDPYKQ